MVSKLPSWWQLSNVNTLLFCCCLVDFSILLHEDSKAKFESLGTSKGNKVAILP